MPCVNTDIFVITVHMFLLTTTWCSMMWMDCIHTVLKLKERLVPLKGLKGWFLDYYLCTLCVFLNLSIESVGL